MFFLFRATAIDRLPPGVLVTASGRTRKCGYRRGLSAAYDEPKGSELACQRVRRQPLQRKSSSAPADPAWSWPFDAADLYRLAAEANVVIELVPQVGDFVGTGDALFRITGDLRPVTPVLCFEAASQSGPERTLDQDPRFVFRLLVDMASKALSPGINDPTTAVQALDQIQHLLLYLGRRHLDEGKVRDSSGTLRLIYGTPDWPDFVMLAVSEVRQFGSGSIQVDRRLRAMLEHLIEKLPEERRPPLQKEMALLRHAIERKFEDEEDRKRANVADYQGVGGSES